MPNDSAAPNPAPDFSAIPGHIDHSSIQAPQNPSQAVEHTPDDVARDYNASQESGIEKLEDVTKPIENYTQEGRAESPILSKIGDVTRGVKELLGGGQEAGKPFGTSEGLINNPVTQALTSEGAVTEDIPAALETAGKVAGKVGSHLAETGKNFGRSFIEEGKAAIAAKAPEGSLEAGFAKIPGYKKIARAPKFEPPVETPKPQLELVKDKPKISPNEQVAASAQRYNEANNKPQINHELIELPSQEERNDLADKFSAAKHEPENPAVVRSYDAMKKETLGQFNHAKNDLGIKFDFTDKDPYTSAEQMQADVEDNHHLSVYTGGTELPKDHPLAEIEPSTGESYNSIFRGTHDIFGHAAGGHDFSEAGEENAYNAHKQMYSDEARPAVRNETQGQSNWYFNNDKVRNGDEQGFPEQKATILEKSTNGQKEEEGGDPNLGADEREPEEGDTSFKFGDNAYHPDLQKIVDKYGETDDPYAIRNGGSFITPTGKFVHLGAQQHDTAILNAYEGKENVPGDIRPGFLEDTGAIRTRYSFDRGRGHTLHITVPKQGVTPEQVDALKQAARVANGENKYGNIVLERSDVSRKLPAQEKENANANHIEPMLKSLDVHPGPKPWMDAAAEKARTGGGFTTHPATGEVPTEGQVGEISPEHRVDLGHPATAEDIQKFTKDNKALLDKHPELHVGGFGNELNISAVGKNAYKVAKKLDQKSIYDLGKGEEIHTGGAGQRQDFANYPMEDRLKDIAGKPMSDIPGFESLSKDFHANLEPDERSYLKDNNLLQSNAMKQYHSISPSVPETTNAMQAGAALGGWWQRYINIFHDLADGGEQVANQIGPSHAEVLKQWHAAVSGNKSVEDANNLAWHSYADWLDAGKPTSRKAIDDIVRKNGAQLEGRGKKSNAAISDSRTKSGKLVKPGLDTTKLHSLINSPEMKGERPFSGQVFNEEQPNPLAGTKDYRKIPSMGATVAGKGNLNRLVIDAHIKDFYGETGKGAQKYIADSVHLRQAAKALGLKGGEGQEQLWGTVLGLKTLLKEGLTPAEASGKLNADVINSIGKDYAEVIANDPEIAKPGGVLDRLKQQHGVGKGSAGISQANIKAPSANTGAGGPGSSQEGINQTQLAQTAGRIREQISPSKIKGVAKSNKKASTNALDFLKGF